MDSSRSPRFQKLLTAIIIINVLITGYLVKTVWDQQRRIQTLERNSAITQSIEKLNSKVDSLKNRLQGLFH